MSVHAKKYFFDIDWFPQSISNEFMDSIRRVLWLCEIYVIGAKYNFGKLKYLTCNWSSISSKGNASVLFFEFCCFFSKQQS